MQDDVTPNKPKKTAIPVKEASGTFGKDKFKTPEEVAAVSPISDVDESGTPEAVINGKKVKSKRNSLRVIWHNFDKKQKVACIVVAVIIVFAGTGGVLALTRHKPAPKPVAKVVPKPTPAPPAPKSDTVASNLTGLQVSPEVNQRPVTGVMIENSPDARPQSGLVQAGVVFEAVAEGGITRFLALFQDLQPDYIGPVRSARPYYLQWCLSFDCALAHVGGSPEALANIKSLPVKDLDEFANSGSYHRISSRFAPHNAYTSMQQLNQLEASKGFGTAKFTGFPRRTETPAKTPTASSIDFAISSALYNPHFQYNPSQNNYKRSEGGEEHVQIDGNGNPQPILPKVVVGIVTQQGIEPDDLHTSYLTWGSGQAYVFQDGMETNGTWHKADANSPLTFTDDQGQPLKFDAGQTWITVLGSTSDVSYSP